jgi:hypothetical protein
MMSTDKRKSRIYNSTLERSNVVLYRLPTLRFLVTKNTETDLPFKTAIKIIVEKENHCSKVGLVADKVMVEQFHTNLIELFLTP